MVIAALIGFAILLVAWLLAPTEARELPEPMRSEPDTLVSPAASVEPFPAR